jgi:Ca2+-binding RTX toxin-like protein
VRAAVIALVLLASLPAAAGAAIARVDVYREAPGTDPFESCSRYAQCPPDTLVVAAAPGEANRMTIDPEPAGFVVRDAGAPVAPGSGCTAIDDHAVRCPAQVVGTVDLGDGDDRFAGGGRALGGPGDDVIDAPSAEGGAGADVITCLPGTAYCALTGGAGSDTVTGGPGDDVISDRGAGEDDVLDGGAGTDVVSYAGHRTAVAVDLSATPQRFSARAESDAIAGFEAVYGGRGADVLVGAPAIVLPLLAYGIQMRGGPGDDTITVLSALAAYGGGGDDVITGSASAEGFTGGSGNDRLTGGPGADRLFGGGGRDVLRGAGGADDLWGEAGADRLSGGPGRDHLRCGPGKDRAVAQRGDRVSGCERVRRGAG